MKKYKETIKNPELVSELIARLTTDGYANFLRLGVFRIKPVPPSKHYDFKTRTLKPTPAWKKITFTPSVALRDMLNGRQRSSLPRKRSK